jgi:hypothetical protein
MRFIINRKASFRLNVKFRELIIKSYNLAQRFPDPVGLRLNWCK